MGRSLGKSGRNTVFLEEEKNYKVTFRTNAIQRS